MLELFAGFGNLIELVVELTSLIQQLRKTFEVLPSTNQSLGGAERAFSCTDVAALPIQRPQPQISSSKVRRAPGHFNVRFDSLLVVVGSFISPPQIRICFSAVGR